MSAAISTQSLETALRLFTRVPDGHHAIKVLRHQPASPYTKGMHVIVDPSDTELVHQGDYAVQWDEHSKPNLIGLRLNGKGQWWIGPAGGGHSQILGAGAITLQDGPYRPEGLQKKLLGRVVGYLGDIDGRPLQELWGSGEGHAPMRDVLELDEFPDLYAMAGKGKCLEPVFADGTRFLFSATDPVEAGDYVVLLRKPNHCRDGHLQALIKRLATPIPDSWNPELENLAVSPVVIVETLTPPQAYVVRLDQLMAIHKCRGVCEAPTYKVTKEEGRRLAEEQRAQRAAS